MCNFAASSPHQPCCAMAISKDIYQTYKSNDLPLLTQWHIRQLRKKNPDYQYHFYDDEAVDLFIKNNFDEEIYNLFKRISIGAAKADFFRYAILYKRGGVYLDIDSLIVSPLATFIRADDVAVITRESHPNMYVQWALVYEAGHPFLEKTIANVVKNLRNNAHPHDVHAMTGPTVYSDSIRECLAENPNIPHRCLGVDYDGHMNFHYPMSKFFLSFKKKHWRKEQQTRAILG